MAVAAWSSLPDWSASASSKICFIESKTWIAAVTSVASVNQKRAVISAAWCSGWRSKNVRPGQSTAWLSGSWQFWVFPSCASAACSTFRAHLPSPPSCLQGKLPLRRLAHVPAQAIHVQWEIAGTPKTIANDFRKANLANRCC